MTKNQIIEKLFLSKNFNDAIDKMEPAYLRDDLRQEIIMIVCEWPEEKVIKLYEDHALEFYTVRVILNQVKSSTSPFTKKFRQTYVPFGLIKADAKTFGKGENTTSHHIAHDKRVERIEFNYIQQNETISLEERLLKEQMEDFALSEIEKLYWYDSEMIKLYLKLGSFRAIQDHTGIPFISCYKNIKKSLATLRKRALEGNPKTIFSKQEIEFIKRNKP